MPAKRAAEVYWKGCWKVDGILAHEQYAGAYINIKSWPAETVQGLLLYHPGQTNPLNFPIQVEGKNIGHARNKINN